MPGISGGVFMLVFGFYEPFMEVLSKPKTGLARHWRLILPFVTGVAVGFWITAVFLSQIFSGFEKESTCLFAGIVAGMFPSMFRDANKKGRLPGSRTALFTGTFFMLALLLFLRFGTGIEVEPNAGWYIFSGILWGLSMIIPGLNSTSLLLFMGLYISMTRGLSRLEMPVLIPWLIGIALALLVFSRGVGFVFGRYYSIAMHAIIGTVLASTIMIIPLEYEDAGQLILCAFLALLGVLLAVGLDWIDRIMRVKYLAAGGQKENL